MAVGEHYVFYVLKVLELYYGVFLLRQKMSIHTLCF